MKIGLFAQTLCTSKGGIERATSRLASWLVQRGHSCIIYCVGSGNGKPLYPVHPDVRISCLRLNFKEDFLKSQEAFIKDDLDVFCGAGSSSIRFLFLTLCNNTGIPLLLSERCDPIAVEGQRMTRRDRLAAFYGADGIHILSEKYLDSLPPFLRHRATVIPNAAPPTVPIDWSQRNSAHKTLLAVGRLDEGQKRFSLLIKAFARLAERFPDWDCRICGTGPTGEEYGRLVDNLGVRDRIHFAGSVDDMESEYAKAHIFCMPSAYEGCPNALLEAQAYGLPSVGFADCGGVNDIIIDGENGVLVGRRSHVALTQALAQLMENTHLRECYAKKTQELAGRFEENSIFAKWEALLCEVAAHKGHTRLNYELLPEGEEDAQRCLHEKLHFMWSAGLQSKKTAVAKLRSRISM